MVKSEVMKATSVLLILLGLAAGCGPLGGGTGDDGSALASYSRETAGQEVPINSGLYGSSVAQSFVLSSVALVSSVTVKLIANGSLSLPHTLTLRVESDSTSGSLSHEPSGTLVSAEATASLSVTNITATTSSSYTFTFSAPFTLSAGSYWLRITASYGSSGTNFIEWAGADSATSDGYAYNAVYKNATSGNYDNSAIGSFRNLVFAVH